jgi:hypothetical protein
MRVLVMMRGGLLMMTLMTSTSMLVVDVLSSNSGFCDFHLNLSFLTVLIPVKQIPKIIIKPLVNRPVNCPVFQPKAI